MTVTSLKKKGRSPFAFIIYIYLGRASTRSILLIETRKIERSIAEKPTRSVFTCFYVRESCLGCISWWVANWLKLLGIGPLVGFSSKSSCHFFRFDRDWQNPLRNVCWKVGVFKFSPIISRRESKRINIHRACDLFRFSFRTYGIYSACCVVSGFVNGSNSQVLTLAVVHDIRPPDGCGRFSTGPTRTDIKLIEFECTQSKCAFCIVFSVAFDIARNEISNRRAVSCSPSPTLTLTRFGRG